MPRRDIRRTWATPALIVSLIAFVTIWACVLTRPSRAYYNLGGHELGEIKGSRHWDINENGRLDNDYTPEEVATLLDGKQFTRSKPGQTGLSFHDYPGQDDWRTDQSGVLYYLLYGVQYYRFTIGKVLAVNKFQFDREGNAVQVHDYEVAYTQGDGTAPQLSTERVGLGLDLNGPAVKRIAFVSSHNSFKDNIVEHTALTANPEVWKVR